MAQLSLYKFVNPGGVRDKNLESITINAQKFMIRKGGSPAGGGATDRTNGMNAYGRKTILGINRLGASINSTITTVSSINKNVKSLNTKLVKADKQRAKFNKFQLDSQKKLLKLKQDKDKRESNAARRSLDQSSEKKSEGLGLGKMFAPIKNVAKKAAGGFLDFIRDLFQLLIKSALVSGVLKWIMDPQNTEKVGKFFIAVRKIFEFFMGLINFGITNMLDGIVKIIDGNIFEKVIGVVQFLVGAFVLFKTLTWMNKPWKILGDLKTAFNLLRMLPKALGIAAKAAKGILMAANALPGWGKVLAAGAVLFTAGATIPAMFPGTVNEQERKTDAAPGSNEEKIKKLEEQKKNLNPLDQLQGKGSEIDEQISYLKTGKPKEYATGGIAQGPDSGYPAMLHGTEAIIPLDNKYTRSGGDPLANVTDGIKSVMSDSKIAKNIGDAMRLPFKAVGAALLTNLGNVVNSLGPVGESSKPFIKALSIPIAQSFGVPANLFDAIAAKDKIKSGEKDDSADGESLADKIGTGNITIKNPSDSGVWSPGGNKTVRGLLADIVSGLLFMTKKVDKKGAKGTAPAPIIPDTTPNEGAKEDSADESSASAVEAAKQGKGSQDLSTGQSKGASVATQQGQSSDQRRKMDSSNAAANRHELPFVGPDGKTRYKVLLNATNGDYEVYKHNGIFWQRLRIDEDKNTLQKQKAFNQVRAFFIKQAPKKGLDLNYITEDDVKRREELVRKYDAEAKAKGVDTTSPPRNRRNNVGTNPPQKAGGGWISGPQSGYPVSLDGGNSTSFIGHGTEWVGMKKASGGSLSSAFVIPFDTPRTVNNPALTASRYREAKAGGYVLPYAGGGELIPDPRAGRDRRKKMSMIRQSLAGGGMIKVDGDGSGWTGTLSMYKGGAKVGKSYKARSGISSKSNVSQKDRFHTKMSPHPDGTYSLVGADYHGYVMAGLGDWSVYIGNSSGSLGSRSGLMFHNDIGNNGTAGCIGIDVGGAAGTKADKDFWKQYQEIKPSKMLINLLGKGAGKVDDLGDQSSGPASNSSSSSSSSSSSGGASGGAAPAENNWWDTLGAALSGDTARKMLGVSSPAAAGTGTPAAGTGTPAAGTPGGKTSTGVPSEPKITTNPDGSVSATTYKYDLGSKELEGFTRKGGPDIVDIAKKEQAMFYEQEVSRLGGGADAGFPADHPLRRAAGGSNDLTKLSTEQLKKMLRTDLTPTDAEFAAAKKAREEGKLKGLSGEALEREVLMATINAKQGTPQAEIKPATPATPTGSQVLQQSAQLKDAKSGEAAKPQVSTINNNQGTSGGGGGGGGTIAINTAGGTNKNNTDFLVPMGHPFRNMVSSEALAAIK